MQACLCTVLAAALAIAPAPTDQAAVFRQLEARMQEHVDQRRYETLAREAEAAYARRDLSAEQRRAMAFFAVHGLHGMWEVGRQAAGLCQARNLLRRVERELGFGDVKPMADRLREATEAALRETGLRNPCAPARATPGQRLPLAGAQPAAQAPSQPPPVPQDMDPETGAPPLLASSLARPPAQAEAVPPAPAPAPERAPAIAARDVGRPPLSPGRIAGGALLLAAGAAGWVGVGLLLRDASRIDQAVLEVHKGIIADGRTMATAEEQQIYDHYIEEHERKTAIAGAVGTAAGLATLGGVLLLALRPRARRLAARPWGTLSTAGVTLAGSF